MKNESIQSVENNVKSLETEKLKKENKRLLKEKSDLIDIIKENVKVDNFNYKELRFYKKFAIFNSISFMILASFLIFFFMNIASK